MIYITGDTHGGFQRFGNKYFPPQKHMIREDYVIITGDFGGLWDGSPKDQYWLDWLEEKPFTTLFVDGNHENFDKLYKLPCDEQYGGLVGGVRPSVLHLRQRGHVYTIAGKRFWCFGGATSIDKAYRTEGRSWWTQEEPTTEQMEYGLSQIEEYGRKFDFIITHDCPSRVLDACWHGFRAHNNIGKVIPGRVGRYLERIADLVSVKCWYFGHYHTDYSYDCETEAGNMRFRALYRDIVRVH